VDETGDLGVGDPATISARTFGEASIDFSAIAGSDPCVGFGSAYLKSRSSDSFTAAMKDFTPPEELNFNNCGKVIIRKQTEPDKTVTDPDPTFGYTQNFATPTTFTLQDDGVKTFTNVPLGSGKTVTEDVLPTGWALKANGLDCSASTGVPAAERVVSGATVTFTLNDAADILDCTYTNELRSTSISSTQSFIPQDTATITGFPTTGFTGTVEFRLFSGLTCSGTALYTDTGNALSSTNSGATAQTDNDRDPVDAANNDTIAGYSITSPGGDFSWEVKYVPAAQGDVHPAQTYCHEESRVTIGNDDTVAPNPLTALTT
jgi:hypothetical protein